MTRKRLSLAPWGTAVAFWVSGKHLKFFLFHNGTADAAREKEEEDGDGENGTDKQGGVDLLQRDEPFIGGDEAENGSIQQFRTVVERVVQHFFNIFSTVRKREAGRTRA